MVCESIAEPSTTARALAPSTVQPIRARPRVESNRLTVRTAMDWPPPTCTVSASKETKPGAERTGGGGGGGTTCSTMFGVTTASAGCSVISRIAMGSIAAGTDAATVVATGGGVVATADVVLLPTLDSCPSRIARTPITATAARPCRCQMVG
jgi:hypothetical protein